ncbi:Csf1p KNAG_0G02030 [Huiozyma naganishii CBS 8797]|uniref:Protein CSF1 n=1 Tax=Huiozyma naganishii (strain ATCC MYA-139 / BCRC 22969 / CBS 8797 / KCTC 17520 / NBRC 10181 / NCYC 3082 / Yp74L-3) TaxID=1071383 RepID=J7R8R2_HUIN7|nr:hypothetical protein KNAG_0G02030 [Kazachstania naganishii CBS 8797]CCK71260.1 hypothetical protein KNAG_0G02030 [Kazachstania naganishii CBS 8797]
MADTVSQFNSISLDKGKDFSWVFLVDWILTLILSITVLFYVGRAIAWFISFIAEWLLWKRYRLKVNIESLRVSLLGGRIFFKNLTIIDKDYTISFLIGQISWRYWLFRPRIPQFLTELNAEDDDGASLQRNEKLACRLLLECEGVELFLYNRTVAYDNTIKMFSKEERAKFEEFLNEHVFTDRASTESSNGSSSEESKAQDEVEIKSYTESSFDESNESQMANDRIFHDEETGKNLFLNYLPLQIKVSHASYVVGNKFTPSLLIVSADSAEGVMDYCQPKEKLDIYKTKLTMDAKNVSVSLKQNIGYNEEVLLKFKLTTGKLSKLWDNFVKATAFVRKPLGLSRKKKNRPSVTANFHQKWRGLSLYKNYMFEDVQNDLDDIEFDLAGHEYAKFTSIIKCPRAILTYEFDIPGFVPHGAHPTLSSIDGPDIGNNGAPPTFGLEIQLFGGSLCYGPWAQRQVAFIQSLLAPQISRDQKPVKPLQPGERRMYTLFKLGIVVNEDITWRIPTRESSKDAEFLRHYKNTNEDYRPFGWLDLKFSKDSYASFNFALCSTADGSQNTMKIHLGDSEIRSSVNHDIFIKSKSLDFDLNLGFPLGWNEKAKWTINVASSQLETFLLREHITLIADTMSDFSTGEPTPYELFRPFLYTINWKLDGYSIYLNVNDHNIVNNPLDFNENCYLSFHGDILNVDITVPKDRIDARATDISYNIYTPMFRLMLNAPPWNTLNEFMKHKEVGRAYDFRTTGNYLIYNELDVDNVDMITIICSSKSTVLHCYGFVIRYLMNIKMNYFGDFFHFVTSEEYTEKISSKGYGEGSLFEKYSDDASTFVSDFDKNNEEDDKVKVPRGPADVRRKTNETDLWLTFNIWEGALLLPETIYNCDPCIALHFGELAIDVRSTNYYMDLLASLDDIILRQYSNVQPNEIFENVRQCNGRDVKGHSYISNINIHGHRMYGLPPTEPTYFCKWDFDLGTIKLESEVDFMKGLVTSFQKIGFGFDDLENVLLYEKEVVDDMTAVTVNVKDFKIIIHNPELHSRAELILNNMQFCNIDFENEKYSTRMDIRIPLLKLSLYGYNYEASKELSFFNFETKINFTNFCNYKNCVQHRALQRDYITMNDAPFHRCGFILPASYQNSVIYQKLYGSIVPSSSLPPLPLPLLEETFEFIIQDFLHEYNTTSDCIILNLPYPDSTNLNSDSFNSYPDTAPHTLSDTIIRKSPLPEDERDNYVIDFRYISISIDPELFFYIEKLLNHFYGDDDTQVIDSIEIGLVKRLSNFQEGISSINNFKIRILFFDVFWGQRDTGGIELYLDTLDFEMNEKSIEKNREKSLTEVTTLMKLNSIRASVNAKYSRGKTEGQPPALSLMVEGVKFWSTTAKKVINSIILTSIDATIDETQVVWLFNFFGDQKELIGSVVKTFEKVQKLRTQSRKELISRLTVASEYYQISHDPYVITKPAFITRLSRGHVRENRSWKIITRLRHIMTYLPDDWNETVAKQLKERKYNASKDAKSIFMSVFSSWRNWEFSDVARSYIYNKVFLANQAEKQQKTVNKGWKAAFVSVYITVYTAGLGVDHSFIVTKSNLVFEETPDTTESGYNQEKVINVTGNLGSIKGKISDKMFKLHNLMNLVQQQEDPALKSISSFSRSFKLNIALLFDSSDLLFVFGETSLTNTIHSGKASFLWENPKGPTKETASLVLYAKRCETSMKHRNSMLFENQITGIALSAAADSIISHPSIVANFQCDDINLRVMPQTEVIVTFLQEFIAKFNLVKESFETDDLPKPTPTNDSPKPTPTKINPFLLVDLDFTCFFSNVSLDIMPIVPFQFRQETKKMEFKFSSQRTQNFQFNIWDSDLYLGSHLTKQQYFRLSLGNIIVGYTNGRLVNTIHNLDVSASIVKLTFSEPHRMLFSFLQDEREVSRSVKKLQVLGNLFSSEPEINTIPAGAKIDWRLNADIKYLGILIPVSTTFFVFEMHTLLASLADVDYGEIYREADEASGQVSVDNILFLIKDRTIPSTLSRIIDLSFKISAIQKIMESHHSYQIESPHLRFCFSPYSLVRILWGGHQLLALHSHYRRHHSKNLWDFLPKKEKKVEEDKTTSFFSTLTFGSCHILSYNFCVGWLFQNNGDTDAGLILGYNRLFSAYEKGCGKLTLVDAFFSVSNGRTSDTFYSDGNEEDKYNRSFLPNLQIIYWLKAAAEMKDVFIRLHGETLDVNFLSSFVKIIEATLQSIQVFQELKKVLVNPLTQSEARSEEEEEESEEHNRRETVPGKEKKEDAPRKDIAPFLSDIRKVNCQFKYDGGIFKVYSFEDIESNLDPSFEIRSPGVTIDLDYKNNIGDVKPHLIRTLITVNSTHNVLFARCAPLLMALSQDIQHMVKKHSSKKKPEPKQRVSRPSQNIDYKRLLNSFDILFKIISSEQKLSLSCEPKAKVQANVGFDSFMFAILTNDLDTSEPLSFALVVKNTRSAIRHIFSREPSASFGLDLIDVTFMFTHPNIINMFGACLISDVEVYFNVKQLQNLYLFLDIWKLSNLLRPKPMKKPEDHHVAIDAPPSSPMDVGNIIPWCFTLIFANINGKVDLGPSLGLLSLSMRKAWFASDHYESKRQLLHAYIDQIKLTAKGRLSGIVELDGALWAAEVNWPKYDDPYPLVALSFVISNISLKVAFDYHMFLIGTVLNTVFHLHSERDTSGFMPDLLKVMLTCEQIDMCSTALVAANLLDLYNTIMRMRQDTNVSYLETLRESNTTDTKETVDYKDILKVLNLIQTDVVVDINTLNVQISPISLFDVEVLVVNIANVCANVKTHAGEKLETYLHLQLYNAHGSLSSSKGEMDEDMVSKISVEDYMVYASKIVGGTIFDIPKLEISMHTFQKSNSDILEYGYRSTFGDKIAVRWNLGPVNFIKEMWTTHIKALAVRRSQSLVGTTGDEEGDVEKRMRDEETLSKLTYIAIEEPQIDTPQIKDLGDATPSLEWFGLNRKKFPIFTHQTVIVPVQKLIHSAEKEYANIVGHSQ